MRILLIFLCLIAAPSFAETKVIKQVMDMNSENIDKMYQFIPDYVEIQPGDKVLFKGTVGSHTAHSIQGMLPEGAEPIMISGSNAKEVTFDKPGVYGIKCKVHHRHGMVALVVVGDPSINIVEARAAAKKRVSRRSQAKMQDLLDKAEEKLN
ncbi:plastocyanin/azurin family copper-binding protein [Vibrio tapetis subsp. quintayensis]|uniref:plastocyanin/azurin family copper-binding protein n=1 Tax=Vibrio tapetis TaxID=52443 RepID=UPI0025B30EAC|nr:plastocyanin/azurin family copper-binding protein [Vibrio tapetis]MDN3682422.1 plastocyanin/azurin family copper-binding protein [Vibrio tapetis subsp. quintayensis]